MQAVESFQFCYVLSSPLFQTLWTKMGLDDDAAAVMLPKSFIAVMLP